MSMDDAMVHEREVAFRLTADPTAAQVDTFWRCAGGARLAFNQCLEWVKADLDSLAAAKMTGSEPPSLRIGRNGLVPRFNAWKNGTAPDSPVADDGRRGLPWAKELPGDCFESAVIDLAVALKNWRESRTGKRKGRRVGFPRFKSKRRSTPSFRLRHPAQLRVEGAPGASPGDRLGARP